ncbi:hypothetical protein AB3S75_026844 [Citrus x aurantiifolia]
MMMMIPTGFRFNPTDEELIEFLFRKLSGQEMQLYGDFIVERGVYELDPQHLQWDYNVALSTNERFYFCLRKNDSREVSGRGWWRATGRVKKVYANYNNQTLVGFKRPLTFHRFSRDEPHDPRTKRNKAIKTNWIMHEYGLESYTTDWRLCKIKYKGKPSVQEELENIIRSAAEEQQQQQQQQLLQDSPIQLPNLDSNNCNYPEDSFFGYYNYYNNHEPSYYNYPGFIDFSGGQVQQQQYLQLDNNNINVYGSDNNNVAENMQMEAINAESEQLN